MDRRSLLRGIAVGPIGAIATLKSAPAPVRLGWREFDRRIKAGLMTVNRVRAEYGLPPIEDSEIRQ